MVTRLLFRLRIILSLDHTTIMMNAIGESPFRMVITYNWSSLTSLGYFVNMTRATTGWKSSTTMRHWKRASRVLASVATHCQMLSSRVKVKK
jgi:hypothetical protein